MVQVSFAAIPTAETDLLAADKPILGVQAAPVLMNDERWTTITSIAGPDFVTSGYPVMRHRDGSPEYVTKPTSAAPDWYLNLDVGAGNEIEIDFIAFVGHNLSTEAITLVQLRFDSQATPDGTYASVHIAPLISGAPSDNTRLAFFDLKHTGSVPLRYSNVRYLQIRYSIVGTAKPEIKEVIFGRRYQMSYKPDYPYDSSGLVNTVETNKARSGAIYQTWVTRNQRKLVADLPQYTSTDSALVEAYWKANKGPFVWVDNPGSAPNDFHLMVPTKHDIDIPQVQFANWPWTLEAEEQGPEASYLANT